MFAVIGWLCWGLNISLNDGVEAEKEEVGCLFRLTNVFTVADFQKGLNYLEIHELKIRIIIYSSRETTGALLLQ